MKKKNHVKAASLIETVMAISIITLCSLLGTLVYASVVETTPPIVRYNYEAAIEANLETIITENPNTYKNRKAKAFTLEKRILKEKSLNNVYSVEISIKTPNDTLLTPIYYYKKSL